LTRCKKGRIHRSIDLVNPPFRAETLNKLANKPPADTADRPWTAKEESQLLDMRNAHGRLWTSIGNHLSRDPESCRTHYHDVMHQRLLGRSKPTPTKVRCLGPLPPTPHFFVSADKARNRICPTCKAWNAEQQPVIISIMDDVDTTIPTQQEDDEEKDNNDVDDSMAPTDNEGKVFSRNMSPAMSMGESIVAVDVFEKLIRKGYV
jgi:Myb-like DNA-binding domain